MAKTKLQKLAEKLAGYNSEEREKALAKYGGSDKDELLNKIAELLAPKEEEAEEPAEQPADEPATEEPEESTDETQKEPEEEASEEVPEQSEPADAPKEEKEAPSEDMKAWAMGTDLKGLKEDELVKVAQTLNSGHSTTELLSMKEADVVKHIENLRGSIKYNECVGAAREHARLHQYPEAKSELKEAVKVAITKDLANQTQALLKVIEKDEKDHEKKGKQSSGRKHKRVDNEKLRNRINELIVDFQEAERYERNEGRNGFRYSRAARQLNNMIRYTFRA